jgi:hypothetical protein
MTDTPPKPRDLANIFEKVMLCHWGRAMRGFTKMSELKFQVINTFKAVTELKSN